MFRKCEECTACCTHLKGTAYGYEFGNGNTCKFLCNGKCDIYKVRPNACMNYECAWTQELISEEMRPDKCGVIASVENDKYGQYLKLTAIREINKDILKYFQEWGKKMNSRVVYLNISNNWEHL
jgi:Fe-S-cluster containining protein